MERRTVLKIVALGALAPKPQTLDAGVFSVEPGTSWAPKDYRLRFFTEEENKLVDELMEMIIPADSHSPGAHAAQVSLFADLMVATGGQPAQKQWREGLRLMQEEASASSPAAALAKAAEHEEHPQTDLEHFFVLLKETTVNGYYTSAIGIHQDLQYQGNTYLASFPGCTIKKNGRND
jgi:hypothetical protein